MTQYSRSSSEEPNRGEKQKRRYEDSLSVSGERKPRKRSRSQERRRSNSYEKKYQRRSPHSRRFPDKIPASRKLFVTNIDGKYSEDEVKDDIKKEFSEFGDVKEIIVKTKQNSSNTYVFVEFEHIDDSIRAQQKMKGQIFKGKELKVQFGKGQRKHDDRQTGQCYVCHRDGHYARDCNDRDRYRGRDNRHEHRRSRSREKHHYRRPPRHHSRSRSSSSRKSYRRRRSYSRDYDRRRDYRKDKDRDSHYYSRNY